MESTPKKELRPYRATITLSEEDRKLLRKLANKETGGNMSYAISMLLKATKKKKI